jgi:hypothetical protein
MNINQHHYNLSSIAARQIPAARPCAPTMDPMQT